MVAEIYGELQTVAADLLTEFSQGTFKYVLTVVGNGPADDPGAGISLEYPFEGVSRGVSYRYLSDSAVSASNLQCTMPGGIVEPTIKGFIVQPSGKRGKITKIDRKPADGPAVGYVIVFER